MITPNFIQSLYIMYCMYIDLSAVSYKNELHSTVSPLPPPFFTAVLSLSLSAGEENFTLLVKSHKSHDFGQILH